MLNNVLPEEKFVKEMIDISRQAVNNFEKMAKVHMDLYKASLDWFDVQVHKHTS